jgi:ABC-type polysaccharide/polyol phosphate export permease
MPEKSDGQHGPAVELTRAPGGGGAGHEVAERMTGPWLPGGGADESSPLEMPNRKEHQVNVSRVIVADVTPEAEPVPIAGLTPTSVTAAQDLLNGLKQWRLWGRLGWIDVRRRYSRTTIGPFWSAISLAMMVLALGSVGTGLWSKRASEYLPFLAAGMVVWVTVSNITNEACSLFIASTGLFRQLRFNYSVMAYALAWRNLITFGHNLSVFVLMSIVFGGPLLTPATPLALIGLVFLMVNSVWIAIVLGMFCLRFRDVQQLIGSLLQISMFVTPIFWPPDDLRGPAHTIFVDLNPLYHFIVLVRSPLLGQVPSAESYIAVILMTIAGSWAGYRMFSYFRKRIAYWG